MLKSFGCEAGGIVYHFDRMAKSFYDLSEKDILALAISMEEEDGKTRSAPWNWRISSGRRD